MNLEQKQSSFWWTRNSASIVYFLRELTGVFIAGWTIYFLTSAIFDPTLTFLKTATFRIASMIGLIAAIFHTITWFWVTVKIFPIPLTKNLQIISFAILIAVWLGISYTLFIFFYAR